MFKISILSSIAIILMGIVPSEVHAANVTTIAEGLLNPYGIAFDNNDLLVTATGALLRIDPSGNVTTVATLNPDVPSAIIPFGSDFITVDPATPPAIASLLRVSPSGDITPITNFSADVIGLAVQNNNLIIVDFNRQNNDPFVGDGRLLRLSPDNTLSVIASENLGGAAEVVVDGDNFWLTDYTNGRLLRVSATGEIAEIATGLGQPLDIEFDGKDFIITDFAQGFNTAGNGRILRVSKSGQVTTLITGIGNPSGITLQGLDVIFTDIVSGRVARINNLLAVPEPSALLGLLMLGIGFGLTIKRN